MTDKEKIREVIEKRYEYWKEKEFNSHSIESEIRMSECQHLLLMVNYLPEEPVSDDLEAETQRYFSEEKWIKKPVEEIAIHFANWQHGKDFDDLLLSEMKFPKEYYERGKADAMNEMKEALQTEYEKGRFDMREEMMKALIGGEIVKDIHNQLSVKSEPLNDTFGDIKFGDKLKIIIIKPEQQ